MLVATPRSIGRHTIGSETRMGLNEKRHPNDRAALLKKETLQKMDFTEARFAFICHKSPLSNIRFCEDKSHECVLRSFVEEQNKVNITRFREPQ